MQSVDNDFGDVGVSLFECLKNAHQHRLCFRSSLATIAVAVFSHHNRTTNCTLRMIVVKRDILMIQKDKQLFTVTLQTFDQSLCLRVFPRRFGQLRQSLFQASTQLFILRLFQRLAPASQTHGVTQNPFQSLRKGRPIPAFVLVLRDLFQIAKQVRKALLLAGADNRIVRTPKVRDQNSGKHLFEKLEHHRMNFELRITNSEFIMIP